MDFFLSSLNLFLSAFFFLIFGCFTFFQLNFTFNFQRCHRHKKKKSQTKFPLNKNGQKFL